VAFVQIFLGMLFAILWLLVLGRVIMSWVDPTGRSRAAVFLTRSTEPMIAPVRRLIPPAGVFDLATLVVLVVLGILWRSFL
jgi:YggT family protein